nr:MAG TPA: hypothetical protein [Herelleviridae sp.]
MKKDILNFIDEYILAQTENDNSKIAQLESEGLEKTTSYTDVAKAITNLTLGVSEQMNQLEKTNELNLNILIDALYKAELINDEVIESIQDALKELDKENDIKEEDELKQEGENK